MPVPEDEATNPESGRRPRLAGYETDDGTVVVCEATNPAAWIESDTALDVDALEAELRDLDVP